MTAGGGQQKPVELVTITIDGRELRVPKGTNLIEAAARVGIEIPHYCYHPNLSVAGNCRMCQVQIEGAPKLTIACNTGAVEGMAVRTQNSSPAVADAQRATLEFILINHPLDCTVCDQAGHCKLQDYYYEYNGKASRFIEDKVHKVKAEPLGPEVIYDGERCILCTRCVRFCEEVPGTSELSVLNRGDRSVIAINSERELDNPFSGTVVDLCPVGALTHRRWRFNTRIWYTGSADTICVGCSTGCNVEAHTRDGELVQIKARMNPDVNKEWLCDEGRYGFGRFHPTERLIGAHQRLADGYRAIPLAEALALALDGLKSKTVSLSNTAVFLSPLLTLEELWISLEFCERVLGVVAGSGRIAMQLRERELSAEETKLISPDFAANSYAAALLGLVDKGASWRGAVERQYRDLLESVRGGQQQRVIFIGDYAVVDRDIDSRLERGVLGSEFSLALSPRGFGVRQEALGRSVAGSDPSVAVQDLCKIVVGSASVYEKSGVMVNATGRLQRLRPLFTPPQGVLPEWKILRQLALLSGTELIDSSVTDERALYREIAKRVPVLNAVSLTSIGAQGVVLGCCPARSGLESNVGGAPG